MMLEITDAATVKIADYFRGREVAPIRIFLNEGGWGGPSLSMALDEPKDTDNKYTVDNFQYIVNKDFMEKVKPIKVDFTQFGFKVVSGVDFSSGCSSCTTTGSCCSWNTYE